VADKKEADQLYVYTRRTPDVTSPTLLDDDDDSDVMKESKTSHVAKRDFTRVCNLCLCMCGYGGIVCARVWDESELVLVHKCDI